MSTNEIRAALDAHDAEDAALRQSLTDTGQSLGAALRRVAELEAQVAASRPPLLSIDPAAFPSGPTTPATWKALTGALVPAQEAARITRTTDDLGRIVLRHKILAGKIGSDGGSAFVVPLAEKVEAARFELRGRFVGGFDWALGGKIPGLSGVAPGVSPAWPSGGRFAGDDGFSARHMWTGGGKGIDYLYGKDQRGRYGDGLPWGRALVVGADFVITDDVRLNTPDAADGSLVTTFNGDQVVNTSTRRFRSRAEVQIGHVMWSLFRGGDITWASQVDGYVDIHACTVRSL